MAWCNVYNKYKKVGVSGMIRGFWQSKLAACVVFAASVGVTVAIWIRDRAYPVYIPALASVLMLSIGYLAGRLLGNVVANGQNTKYLGLLHMELDPQAFLQGYAPVPDRLKAGTPDYAVARAYLADGYGAAGEFDRAIATLCPDCRTRKGEDPALKGLYYNNLCAYTLGKEDLVRAREALQNLETVVTDTQYTRPALSLNFAQCLRLYRNRLACLEGGAVDVEWLEEQLPKAQYKLRRLELAQTLAQWALREGELSTARKYLKLLSQEAGKTHYRAWASRQESRLSLNR